MSRYLFVTGRLAAHSLRNTLKAMEPSLEYRLAVLPISVAALMDTRFVAEHLADAQDCDRVMIPGLCGGPAELIADRLGIEVIRGPENLKDIPEYFGKAPKPESYGAYGSKIIAEIVDAHRMSLDAILSRASYFRASGADIIDLGCPVGGGFPGMERAIRALKKRGYTVSVDSMNPEDILRADRAGADMVLSVHSANLEVARRIRCKVVVIPDPEQGLESLERNIARLEDWKVRYIIDPVLNPISLGFAESIGNFIETRRRHPNAEMLMGLGNLTELTDADTTGVTAVMAGFAAELEIDYLLTTEVISWARGAVRELDIARRLMFCACRNKMPPKRLNDGLITVKDPPFDVFSGDELRAMQAKVRDRNFRIFADRGSIYVFNNRLLIRGTDVQGIFNQLGVRDAAQAFYLGRELEKARLAIQLGKKYTQEEALRWGYLSSE